MMEAKIILSHFLRKYKIISTWPEGKSVPMIGENIMRPVDDGLVRLELR